MNSSPLHSAITLLDRLRRELIDEAFDLEQQDRLDAADLAIATATRIALAGEQLRQLAAPAGARPPLRPAARPLAATDARS